MAVKPNRFDRPAGEVATSPKLSPGAGRLPAVISSGPAWGAGLAALIVALVLVAAGCVFHAYPDRPGPSIRLHPEVHDDGMTNEDCRDCHDPKDPAAPPTRHLKLGRCLECHDNSADAPTAQEAFRWVESSTGTL
jgi:hypothetical protein